MGGPALRDLGAGTPATVAGAPLELYSYNYDAAGNRLSKTEAGVTMTYSYNSLDQLVQSVSGGTTTVYAYDAWGNLKTETRNGTLDRTYTWDNENRLLSVTLNQDNVTVAYAYDEQGGRIGRTRTGGSGSDPAATRYLTDYGNLSGYSQAIAELDGNGIGLQSDNVFASDLLAQTASTNATTYLHADHLGTVRASTGASGNAIASMAYTPFGESPNYPNPTTSYAFTGQSRDATTGLQYHRDRLTDLALATWFSADRAFDFPHNFGNSYLYVGGSPINFVDPSGSDMTLYGVSFTTGALVGLAGIGLLTIGFVMARLYSSLMLYSRCNITTNSKIKGYIRRGAEEYGIS